MIHGRFNSLAFTLVEMLVSLGILSIILLACGSIVMMATRATTDGAARSQAQMQAADALTQLTDDLNVAANFTQRTATNVSFTVPDRLKVGSPQVVSYSWTGTVGDPLLRQFNGGTATSILGNVQSLRLDYLTRSVGPAPPPAEQLLASHTTTVGTLKDYNLSDKAYSSQFFTPILPLGTSSYTLTRVRLYLKTGPQNAAMVVSIRVADLTTRPTNTVLSQATVYEAALSSAYEWIDIPISGLSNQNPLQGLCIVMSPAAGSTNIGSVQIDQSVLTILLTQSWSTSTNAGANWALPVTTTAAKFMVFGTVP